MNKSNFTAPVRREYLKKLKENGPLRSSIRTQFWNREREAKQSILIDHMNVTMGSQFMDELAATKFKLDELTRALSERGFDFDGYQLFSLSRFAPEGLEEIIEKEVEGSVGTYLQIHERIENARIAMLTAQTLEEAEKIMQPIRELIN